MWDLVKFVFFCTCIVFLLKTCDIIESFDLNDFKKQLKEINIEDKPKEKPKMTDTSKTEDIDSTEESSPESSPEGSTKKVDYDDVGDF